MLGPKKEVGTRELRKIYSADSRYVYTSSNIISDQINKNEIDWERSTNGTMGLRNT
jgi:hypothetical protein